MIKISHRGNISCPNQNLENCPDYILNALKQGFNCEVDVFLDGDKFFLGHDYPKYEIEESFLENEKLWCHAKNLSALYKMVKNPKIHSFWHENDNFTLTSKNFIWTYPERPITDKSILLVRNPFEFLMIRSKNLAGICSDYISKF